MNEAASLVHKKVTLDDMWDVCCAIASEMEGTQGALVKAGILAERDPGKMWRVLVLETICRFIEVTREIEPEFRALVMRRRGLAGKRRGEPA
jgi:hypothetical protein